VAVGAAIQGAVLAGEVRDVVLLDVTPLSLGIETLGGVMTVLIERNTTVPTSKKEVFSTAADSQPAVDIHVLQGERPRAGDNRTLGKFQLAGIPPAPRGIPQIEVTFDIDANGILHVSAKDLGTGKEQSIQIKSSSGLDEKQIENMVKEAEEHAADDKKQRELIEKRNRADSLSYQTRRLLKEHGDKLPAGDKSAIEKAVEELEKAAKGDDADEIARKEEALTEASYKLSEMLYKQAAANQGQPGAGPAGGPGVGSEGPRPGKKGGDDDVIDADFEVKS